MLENISYVYILIKLEIGMRNKLFSFNILISLFFILIFATSVSAECGCGSGIECNGGVGCVFDVCLGACMSGSGERCGGSPIAYCKSGLQCVNKVCKPQGVLGTSCVTNVDCDSGLYCDLFTCKSKKSVGGSCTADWACESGLFCVDFSCQERGDSTEKCVGIGQGSCESGLVCDVYGECRHDAPLIGELCDKSNPVVPTCSEDLFCNVLRCDSTRKTGEECFDSVDCEEDLECRICLSENCNFNSQCFPKPSDEIIDKDECLSIYSSIVHESSKDEKETRTFGTGSVAVVGVGATTELGTIYGDDGRYGCYLSYCSGGELSAGISSYSTVGLYDSYDAFISGSKSLSGSTGIGEFVSISTAQVFDNAGDTVGTQDSFGFGVGLSPPVSAGYYSCNSIIRTVIEPSGIIDKIDETPEDNSTVNLGVPLMGEPLVGDPVLGEPVLEPVSENLIDMFFDWLKNLYN